jgi:hypothetical protein
MYSPILFGKKTLSETPEKTDLISVSQPSPPIFLCKICHLKTSQNQLKGIKRKMYKVGREKKEFKKVL